MTESKAEIQEKTYPKQWQIQDFPLGGGASSHWGGANLQHRCFLAKTCAKMKELDPVVGGTTGSINVICWLNGSHIMAMTTIAIQQNLPFTTTEL